MATVTLGSKAEGSIVNLNESGSPVEFYVAKQNYESGLNGTGRALLVRKDCYDNQAWDAGNVNAYASSDIDAWFNSTYKNLLDPDIQQAIGTTKFYYTPGNGNNTIGALERSVFALSLAELGLTPSGANVEGSASPVANTLKIAYLNGNANTQWTRSPYTGGGAGYAWGAQSDGSAVNHGCTVIAGRRPVFALPATAYVLDDGTITLNHPPTAPASITIPTLVSGAQAAITWTAATDADGTISGYTLERSINGSGWAQIFSGNALTYTDTIGDWGTVAYRVCAVDNNGVSGDYKTSETVTVQEGIFYIGGPAPDMGEQTAPFDFTITTGISGTAQAVTGVTCTIVLDGYTLYTDYTSTGEDTTVNIDVRAISGGTHTITAKADKAGYVSAVQQYTFTTPAISFPDGGQAEQLQNQSGTPIFLQTTAALVQGLKGESIAGNIEELYNVKVNDVRSYPVREGESISAGDVVNVDGDVYRDVTAQANVENVIQNSWPVTSQTDICYLNEQYSVAALAVSDRSDVYLIDNLTGKHISNRNIITQDVQSISLARLDDTHFVVQYRLPNGGSYEKVGEINGTVITLSSSQYGISSGIISDCTLCLDPNTRLSIYSSNNSGSYKLYLKIDTVSGTKISTNNIPSALDGLQANYISACKLPDDSNGNKRVCICFADTGDGNKGKAVIATIDSSNAVTFGDVVEFSEASTTNIHCTYSLDGWIYVLFIDSATQIIAFNPELMTEKTEKKQIAGTVPNLVDICAVGYSVVGIYGSYAQTIYRTGNVLNFGAKFDWNNSYQGLYPSASITENNRFIIAYADGSNANYGTTTILEVSGNQIAGSFIDNSKDAIALESGESGEIIKLGFGGYCECEDVTEGKQITSDGVAAYSPLDGWLEIKDAWSKGYVIGEYTGDGTFGADNPTVIDVGFTPSVIIIISSHVGTDAVPSSVVFANGMTGYKFSSNDSNGSVIIWNSTGISIYTNSTNAVFQYNSVNYKYYYIAWR